MARFVHDIVIDNINTNTVPCMKIEYEANSIYADKDAQRAQSSPEPVVNISIAFVHFE